MSVPPININRKGYNGKETHNVKKVQWVRIRRVDTDNTPTSGPFIWQEDGFIKKEEINDGRTR